MQIMAAIICKTRTVPPSRIVSIIENGLRNHWLNIKSAHRLREPTCCVSLGNSSLGSWWSTCPHGVDVTMTRCSVTLLSLVISVTPQPRTWWRPSRLIYWIGSYSSSTTPSLTLRHSYNLRADDLNWNAISRERNNSKNKLLRTLDFVVTNNLTRIFPSFAAIGPFAITMVSVEEMRKTWLRANPDQLISTQKHPAATMTVLPRTGPRGKRWIFKVINGKFLGDKRLITLSVV